MKNLLTLFLLSFSVTLFASEVGSIAKADSAVCDRPDKLAQYSSGSDALRVLISTNLVYPIDVKEQNVQAKVFVQFDIERDGTFTHIEAMKSGFSSLDAEAVRLVKLMPKWIPAEKNGKTVRVRLALPILFQLDKKRNEL